MPSRTALRYFGGKWKLAPWIIGHFPKHRVYVEPFGGGASVLLRKPRAYSEVYNDLDGEVVNLFQILRDPDASRRLSELLTLTPYSRTEFEAAYNIDTDPMERARRLVIRSFMGFGSNACNHVASTGFRSNSNRSGTTPAHGWANYPDGIPALVERLRGVVIESRDALQLLSGAHDTPETLFYVDPPYLAETRVGLKDGRSNHCYAHEFATEEEHRALAEVLHGVKGMVVLSGYPSALYKELFESRTWRRVDRAAFADGAAKRTESLWLNPSAMRGAEQLSLVEEAIS